MKSDLASRPAEGVYRQENEVRARVVSARVVATSPSCPRSTGRGWGLADVTGFGRGSRANVARLHDRLPPPRPKVSFRQRSWPVGPRRPPSAATKGKR